MKKTMRGIDSAVRFSMKRVEKERTIGRKKQRELKRHAQQGAVIGR